MSEALLVLNAGSSSLKFSLYTNDDPPRSIVRGGIEGLPARPRFSASKGRVVLREHEWDAGTHLTLQGAIDFLFTWGRREVLSQHHIVAVGHRVTHGGTRFNEPVVVDASTLAELEALIPLAPLQQPHNLSAIRAVTEIDRGITQVACFDTAFHQTQPSAAQAFALPARYAQDGVRRYGFHGLSYEYIVSVLARGHPQGISGRTIVAHLDHEASMCAIRGGRSIATTMGFSALDGLMMGTHCGAIDPGVLLYLMDEHDMSSRRLRELLSDQSGLLGVSGLSSDIRSLLASTDRRAAEAVELFVYRARRELGSLAAALAGVDTLVFTGAIGEHAPSIRARICQDASWFGLSLDDVLNDRGGPRISRLGSRVSAWVIPTNEDLMIATHTRHHLVATVSATRTRSSLRRQR